MSVRVDRRFLKRYREALREKTGLRSRSKNTSHLMRFLARRVISKFNVDPKGFMENFSTTLYFPLVRAPVCFYSWRLGSSAPDRVLRSRLGSQAHEGTHAYQILRDSPRTFSARYATSSRDRAQYEAEAYSVSLCVLLYMDEHGLRSSPIDTPPPGHVSVGRYTDYLIDFYTKTLQQNYMVDEVDVATFRRTLVAVAGDTESYWRISRALRLLRKISEAP